MGNGRRFPVGAELTSGGVDFRVWAPTLDHVAVVIEGGDAHPMTKDEHGVFVAQVHGTGAGTRYTFRLGDAPGRYADPVARALPEGPHGPAEVIDPDAFAWTDRDWRGVRLDGQVIYEMHVGTFTPEGTWRSAMEKLAHLKDVGVTLIEMMPVNTFGGAYGWGYDGVGLFAPAAVYGAPDDLRRFVDAAHALGLGVILDVVYNHFGPDGNYMDRFSPAYFTSDHANEWGLSINFYGENAVGVRDFFTSNAAYWIAEYHFDGLRLDAVQALFDDAETHIVADIVRAARQAAGSRTILIVAENEEQSTRLLREPEVGGYGVDAAWNDDYHHSAVVAVTGQREAYYADTLGTPQELISAMRYGYLFQGQRYTWHGRDRGGPPFGLEPRQFVSFVENHDQVANSAHGTRIRDLTSPGRYRAITALTLLGPQTPMLFQGQEFGATTPFQFFANFGGELRESIRKGRTAFLRQFPNVEDAAMTERLPDPCDPAVFKRSKIDWSECDRNKPMLALHRDLLRLRRTDLTFASQPGAVPRGRNRLDGAVLANEVVLLRFFGATPAEDRLLFVNLGVTFMRTSIADPLVAAPEGLAWTMLWSSEDPAYGGNGTPPTLHDKGWTIASHAALVLAPVARRA